MNNFDYKNMTPFKWFVLENFPFIENDFDAINNYHLFSKVVEYLNKTIDNMNLTGEQMENVTNAMTELQNYVNNYFDNLDVQEEINNKLDEMVEDGTFQELVGNILIKKLDFYEITNQTEEEIQQIFNISRAKIISFKNDYTFTKTQRLNSNTTLLLNNHTLNFNIPTVTEDYTKSHGFFNFNDEDEFLKYEGNGNIKILNGYIVGGNCSFIHASNIIFENIHFLNCKNDHILELCALNNVKISNCTFSGIPSQISVSNMTKEYIQWENATQSNFPHFSNPNSNTYDNTPCTNIEIKNCAFLKPANNQFDFYTAIGNHNEVVNYPHNNIKIENCLFEYPKSATINFYNTNDVIISKNKFKGNNINAILDFTCHIRARHLCNNIKIKNNFFSQSFRAIENSPNSLINNWIIEQNNFEDYNLDNVNYPSTDYAIIDVDSICNLSIKNNRFSNLSQKIIHLDNTQINNYPTLVNEYPEIINNYFNPNKNMNSSAIHFSYGHIILINNIYNITGFNNNYHYVLQPGGSDNLIEIISKNNIFNDYITINAKYIIKNAENIFWYKKIFDFAFTGYYGDITEGNSVQLNYNKSNFNAMRISLTSNLGTYSININSWDITRKLDERSYVIPVDTTFVTFKLNSDNTFDYNSYNTNVHLRSVYLYNNERNI